MSAPMDVQPGHHVRLNICATRKKYREGRRDTAVKVYTVHQESKYLLVQGVPAVGASQELIKLFALYGAIEEYRILDEYPAEDEFTEVYWVKFKKIQAARIAKRKMDDFSFFGGVLHVCYAPEYESVEECRQKLLDRRKSIAVRIRKLKEEEGTDEVEMAEETPSKTNVADWDSSQSTSGNSKADSVQMVSQSNVQSSWSAHESNTLEANVTHFQHLQTDTSQSFRNGSTIYDNSRHGTYGHDRGQGYSQHFQGHNFGMTPNSFANPYATPVFQTHGGRSQFDHARVPSSHATLPPGFNPYPESSELHNNYHNRLVEKSNKNISENSHEKNMNSRGNKTEEEKNERVVSGIVIRDCAKKQTQAPKFVPRQTISKKRNVNMDVDTFATEKKAKTVSEPNGDAAGKKLETSVIKRDKLDEELRRNAFVLGPVAGPSGLPADTNATKSAKTNSDASIEKSRAEIREKLKKFSTIAIPRQVLKKKTGRSKLVKGSDKPSTSGQRL